MTSLIGYGDIWLQSLAGPWDLGRSILQLRREVAERTDAIESCQTKLDSSCEVLPVHVFACSSFNPEWLQWAFLGSKQRLIQTWYCTPTVHDPHSLTHTYILIHDHMHYHAYRMGYRPDAVRVERPSQAAEIFTVIKHDRGGYAFVRNEHQMNKAEG